MRVNAYEFDNHPNLINCKNGTFDLKEQKFYEPKQEDKLTMQTAFNFTEGFQDKKCERWERFIEEITEGDKDKAEYLQKTLGYSILGSSKEECMFMEWEEISKTYQYYKKIGSENNFLCPFCYEC